MKVRSAMGVLLLWVTPGLAAPQPVGGQMIFSATPRNVFEAGMEKVDGATGDSSFIHAKLDGSITRQVADLAIWVPATGYLGKRLRLSTRLKVDSADRASCSLESWDDSRVLLTADGGFRAGTGDWQDCAVVMQIPDKATRVRLRYYLRGNGKVWSDGFSIEEVGADVPETHRISQTLNRNLDER